LSNIKTNVGIDLIPLSLKEVSRYIRMIAILLQLTNKETSRLLSLGMRICTIWNKSGVKFTIQYLSEASRLVGISLAGIKVPNTSIWVSRYKNGYPKVLGLELYRDLCSLKWNLDNGISPSPMHRGIISVLFIFRAMGLKEHIPNFKTLTSPFIGKSQTLDKDIILTSLSDMGALDFFKKKLRKPIFFWSNKAGVNASFAFLSIGMDLIAIMRKPRVWLSMFKYSIHSSFYLYAFLFLSLSILFIPFALIWPIDLYLGRLSLIKELRGKTRIIGITDMWTQWLFKPLHDLIYEFLDSLQEDGTRDQLSPVKFILEKRVSDNYFSLDLSAATDRLPVLLQSDILEALGLNGKLWKEILDRSYYYDGVPYKYNVGQPMGAYSSFAMLALTNHVLMYAASRVALKGPLVKGVGNYAVLGDDVLISKSWLARSYSFLMNDVLGVVINPIKGFEGKLIEFAKNWFTSEGVNLTPLGAKSLLRSIRSPLFITSVIADYNKKEYNSILKLELQVLFKIMRSIFSKEGMPAWKWIFSIIGPQGGFWRLSSTNLDVKSMETLFKEFLSQIGVSFTDVTDFYYKKLVKSSWTSVRSLSDLMNSYLKLFYFILKPFVWSKKKMISLGLNPKYTAVLATATVSVVAIPLLFLSFLRALRVWMLLLFVSMVGCLFGAPYISNIFVRKFSNIWNTLKRNYHNFILHWELVKAGYAQPSPITLMEKPKKPIPRVLNSSLLFSRWMLGMKTNRPIQLLVDRVKSRSDDELPAIKTAEKCLSKLLKEYNSFNSKIKAEQKRIQKLKVKKGVKKLTLKSTALILLDAKERANRKKGL